MLGEKSAAGQRFDDALDGSVVRVWVDAEAKAGHQAEHLAIGRQHVADHCAIPFLASTVDKRCHQLAADATFLPVVTDCQGKFNRFTVRIDDVARNANLNIFAAFFLRRQDGNQRHLAVVVDLREADQHGLPIRHLPDGSGGW